MNRRTRRAALAAGVTMSAVLALVGCTTSGSSSSSQSTTSSTKSVSADALTGTIYYLIPQTAAPRFEKYDSPNIKAALAQLAPHVTYKTLNAGGDAGTQQSQVEAVIAQKPLAVIFGAANTQQSGGMLVSLRQAGIPVINYASEADGGPLNYYVTVPFSQIGQEHGQYLATHLPAHRPVRLAEIYGDPGNAFYNQQAAGFAKYLDPLIKNGTVKVVCKADALGFSASLATTEMEQCLQKTSNGVDAVLGMNDDTLTGVEAAITNRGLTKQITLYGGYDATLEAVQRVAAGIQPITMSPPYKAMATTAVQLALSTISNYKVPSSLTITKFNNHFAEIPTVDLPSVVITAANMQQTVVDTGIYTRTQICAGVAKTSSFCTA